MESPRPEKLCMFYYLTSQPTPSEVSERVVSHSSSTERPPGQTLGSWVPGADRTGTEGRRGQCRSVVPFARYLQIPEALQFLPGACAGLALLFGRIQQQENATDGSGRRHRGAGRGGSQRSSGGHRSGPAGSEEGRRMVEFSSGRPVARVL